ncbi:MAG: PfkB family carbohydrate kinase [Bacteroidota bacterium]
MDSHPAYDVVCIGNYTRDTIVTPSGTTYVDGGAVNYAAHAIVRLGLKPAVVTHLAREDSRVVDKFLQDGIDCFPVYTLHSTNMRLEYPTHDPDVRTLTVTEVTDPVTPAEIEPLKMHAAVIGSSLRGEVGLDVIRALREKEVLLAADMQGFVRVLSDRQLRYEPWDEMSAALPYLDILKSDAVEAEYLTGESDIFRAAKVYADMGAREIVLTHRDGLLVYADGRYHTLQFHARQMDGRSGRGDTCLGTYVAMRLSAPAPEAARWAAALTSLKMERRGPFSGTKEEVQDLIRGRYL